MTNDTNEERLLENERDDTADLRTDPLPVDREDDAITRMEAIIAPRPVSGYAPVNSAIGMSPIGLTGEPMLGGAVIGGVAPTLLGLAVPEGGSGNDGHLADAVEKALAEEPRLATQAVAGIRVSVAFGVVELEGNVPTEADRQIAGEIVEHLPHVADVRNRLTVRAAG